MDHYICIWLLHPIVNIETNSFWTICYIPSSYLNQNRSLIERRPDCQMALGQMSQNSLDSSSGIEQGEERVLGLQDFCYVLASSHDASRSTAALFSTSSRDCVGQIKRTGLDIEGGMQSQKFNCDRYGHRTYRFMYSFIINYSSFKFAYPLLRINLAKVN